MPELKRIYFPHLDLIRFIAAFMIVMLHSYDAWHNWFAKTQETFVSGIPMANSFMKNLAVGVDIFFLISGFLITYILLEEKKRTGKINILKFMARRSLRILPLYFLIIIIAPFLISWIGKTEPNYWPTILFVNNFQTINTTLWVYPFSHFWSICIEEHFYLVWPFVIAFIPKKWFLNTCFLLIVCSILFRLYAFYYSDHAWYNLYLHTLSRIDVIVIGAIGAYFFSIKPFNLKLTKTVRICLITLIVIALSIESTSLLNSPFLAAFKKYIYVALFSLLLLDYNFNPNFKHLLPNKSFIHYLGKVSYGIYMFSNLINIIIIKKIILVYDIQNIYLFFFLSISLSLIIPIISYELFEKHILKLSKYFRVIKTDR